MGILDQKREKNDERKIRSKEQRRPEKGEHKKKKKKRRRKKNSKQALQMRKSSNYLGEDSQGIPRGEPVFDPVVRGLDVLLVRGEALYSNFENYYLNAEESAHHIDPYVGKFCWAI
jgi:hypothetical protein